MTSNDFAQIEWDDVVADDCRHIVRLAVREDLGREYDWTSLATVPQAARGTAAIVARQGGIVAGWPALQLALSEMGIDAEWKMLAADGQEVERGQTIAELHGSLRGLLTAERLLLNLLGRLSGIATLTRRFVDAVAGTGARIYDTRKTTPGWRRMEKYAVRCGGGRNHRTGLFDAVLIKDNHLAFAAQAADSNGESPAAVVRQVRAFLAELPSANAERAGMMIEIEVDTLDQLADVLPAAPDIVLLDNMTPGQLCKAVALRNEIDARVELEASGGIRLETVRAVAETGVDRISVGSLTHAAASLDVALDWTQ